MRNVQIYDHHIEQAIAPAAGEPQEQMNLFLRLLAAEQIDTRQPILYGYDSVRRLFWFRNDKRGEAISLPLHRVRVWPSDDRPW